MCVFEADHANHQAHAPRDQQKAGDCGQGAGSATQLGADADRDPDDAGSRQELGEADDIEKFCFAEPAAALDRNTARPDDPAAKAER